MDEKSVSIGRFRLVFQRGSILLKCVVLVTLVLCIAALMTLRSAILDVRAENAVLREQAAALEQSNRQLETYIDELGTVQSVVRIAMEELGLANPNITVLNPKQ